MINEINKLYFQEFTDGRTTPCSRCLREEGGKGASDIRNKTIRVWVRTMTWVNQNFIFNFPFRFSQINLNVAWPQSLTNWINYNWTLEYELLPKLLAAVMVILSQSIITVIGHVNFQSILGFANQDEGSNGKIISKYQ